MALEYLVVHAVALQELDLSGCYKIDGETLCLFVDRCPRLKPERLAYCNDIEDGPYPDSANGCLNLDCEIRFCCQKMRNWLYFKIRVRSERLVMNLKKKGYSYNKFLFVGQVVMFSIMN